MSAPLFDARGQLAGVLDVSSARADLTDGISALIVQPLTEAAVRIESTTFRDAYPHARLVMLPNIGARNTAALLAVDGDDLVIGATRAARLQLNLMGEFTPIPAADVLGQAAARETLEDGERAVLMRALARAQGNASAAARALGISRATFHRKIGPKA
jgi:transcriptional regulator of acetoin/glycerol metabolism